jgi:hypothetical protein
MRALSLNTGFSHLCRLCRCSGDWLCTTGSILTLILTPHAHYATPSNQPLLPLLSVHRPISRHLIASDLILKGDLRPRRRREFVDIKHVIMLMVKSSDVAVIVPMALPSCFCIARLRNRIAGCGKLRTNLERARRTVSQLGMYNIQTGKYTECNGAKKLWSYVLSLLDGPHPTHSSMEENKTGRSWEGG